MKWITRTCLIAVSALLGTTVLAVSSADVTSPKLMTRTVPVASSLLTNSYRYMGKLKRFAIDAVTTNEDIYTDKMVVTYTHHIHIDLNRPNELHIETHGDLKNRDYYINRGHFTVYDKDLNYYGTLEVPVKVDDALDFLFEKFDIKTSLANILYTDLYNRIPPKSKGYYFGVSDVDDIPCHHIGFLTATQEFQVWIEIGEHPLIRKFIVIDKTVDFRPRSGTILRWDLQPKFNKSTFIFEKPKGAIQINIEPASEEEAE
jgi:hypothetical protein